MEKKETRGEREKMNDEGKLENWIKDHSRF